MYEQQTSMLAVVPLIMYNLHKEGVVLPLALTWSTHLPVMPCVYSTVEYHSRPHKKGVNMLT